MTCREFQSQWDERLDADARAAAIRAGTTPGRPDGSATPAIDDGEEALLAHASSCPECRELAAQWRALRHAIRAWRQPPVPPAGLADRILAESRLPQSFQWKLVTADESMHLIRMASILVAAAVLVALLLPMISLSLRGNRPVNPRDVAARSTETNLHAVSDSARHPDGRHQLDRALAEATSATWDLARSASEPAARISRDVLDATTRSEDVASERTSDRPLATGEPSDVGAAGLTVPVPSLDQLAPDASAVLQQVGNHLSAGVRPLSDTARHAFGFLIGPARDQPGPRTSSPSAKGA
jgi:hypothetical protein